MSQIAAAFALKATLALGLFSAAPASAEAFRTITERSTFLNLVEGRELRRLGIRLQVGSNGAIAGRAFGRSVTGNWRWEGGYFCRDLYYGSENLGPNCQQVKFNGNTMRFISDQGTGIYADLRLQSAGT